jgi:hypothetical protein
MALMAMFGFNAIYLCLKVLRIRGREISVVKIFLLGGGRRLPDLGRARLKKS